MLYKIITKIVFTMNLNHKVSSSHPSFFMLAVEFVVFGQRSREICLKTFSTSPSSTSITLLLLKRISSNGLCLGHLGAPSAYSLKLFNTLYLVASPTLMMVGIPGVITQFFCISLNLCHQLRMTHCMLIFLLFHPRL